MPRSGGAQPVWRPPDRAWAPAVVVAGLVGCVLVVLLIRIDASRLVRAAPPWTDPAAALPSLTVLPHEYEFDGQFFCRLCLAPLSTLPAVGGVTFDLPALRGSRWVSGRRRFCSASVSRRWCRGRCSPSTPSRLWCWPSSGAPSADRRGARRCGASCFRCGPVLRTP